MKRKEHFFPRFDVNSRSRKGDERREGTDEGETKRRRRSKERPKEGDRKQKTDCRRQRKGRGEGIPACAGELHNRKQCALDGLGASLDKPKVH